MRKRTMDITNAIREKVDSGEWPNGSRLPSNRDLARELGVSKTTLRKILNQLKDEGLLHVAAKSGVTVTSPHDRPAETIPISARPVRTRARRIAESITRAISFGTYRVGSSLPLRKVLQHEYSTSPLCLAHALDIVEKSGLIHRRGARLVAGPQGGAGPATKGHLLVFGNRGTIQDEKQVNMKFLVALENSIRPSGVRLEPHMSWDFDLGNPGLPRKVPVRTRAIAVLLRRLSPVAGQEARAFRAAIRKLLQTRLPVILFGIGGFPNLSCRSLLGPCDNLYLFGADNVQAGEEVASFAVSHGHRSIAYFRFDNEQWSRDRSKGISRRFRSALGQEQRFVEYAAEYDKAPLRGSWAGIGEPARKILDGPVSKLVKNYRFSNPAYYDRLSRFAYLSASKDSQKEYLVPLFDRALQDKRSTLWVCADATVAALAADFLDGKGLRAPGHIHLMCIDDQTEMLQRGITSHGFDWDRMGYMAARAAIGDIPVQRKRNRMVVCPGAISDRGSVGRA